MRVLTVCTQTPNSYFVLSLTWHSCVPGGGGEGKMAAQKRRVSHKEEFFDYLWKAHCRALICKFIATAFQKTGVFPFNHNVVTADMMAPSQESSWLVTLSIVPPTSVWVVTELICKASEPIETPLVTQAATPPITPTSTHIGPLVPFNTIPYPFTVDKPVQGVGNGMGYQWVFHGYFSNQLVALFYVIKCTNFYRNQLRTDWVMFITSFST